MESYTAKLWNLVTEKVGALTPLIESAADNLAVAVKEDDAVMGRVYAKQVADLGGALTRLGTVAQKAFADDKVTLREGAEITVALESCIDEAEDIIQGYDEDTGTPDAKWKVGDIKSWLTKNEIEFPSDAKKDDLLALVPE